jgi:two-component system phosphate regulon sensor histidine kinase PhoR
MSEEPNAQIEHERLTSLINSMADAVIAVDENIDIVMHNSSALNILDVNNISLNTNLAEQFKPIDKNNQAVDINKLVESAKLPITNRDLRLSYKDGSSINLYISVAPVKLGYGERGQKGYVILLRYITREKSLEEERDEFISVVSHELRTPITIAEGNISNAMFVTNKESSNDTVKQSLKAAHRQILFLADMINDLSTLSRAERGILKLDLSSIDVAKLISDLMDSYKEDAQHKNLTISSQVDPEVGNLSSSQLYVKEILQNFITNALKYTHAGSITVTAKKYDKGICFSVADTGIGISKSDQERVFDKFFRSEDYRTREANGTGLGLYVTLKLVKLVHGDIKLTSELNHGSTFQVYIPNLS